MWNNVQPVIGFHILRQTGWQPVQQFPMLSGQPVRFFKINGLAARSTVSHVERTACPLF
ncbi:MAG: hypothetical protein ACPG8W_09430 [Candidatus Promineifilaceae bacterium]